MGIDNFIKKFQIPAVAHSSIDKIFTDEEIDFIDRIEKDTFTKEDVEKIVGGNADEFIKTGYRRGVISIADESAGIYSISTFYNRLDVFSISEQEVYGSIPAEDRVNMDAWYFDAYYDGLDPDLSVRPTQDAILPLDQVLGFIDAQDRPVYLNHCDCRSLGGDCGKPTRTCITYKNGINSFVHRGLSEEIDKERAKEIVKQADRNGLVHTVNPNGICNCCGDCCYLFRSQERRGSSGFWPKTEQLVAYDPEKCTQCGACIRRCHFNVFTKADGRLAVDASKCIGCGICVNSCPAKSLTLKERDLRELRGL